MREHDASWGDRACNQVDLAPRSVVFDDDLHCLQIGQPLVNSCLHNGPVAATATFPAPLPQSSGQAPAQRYLTSGCGFLALAWLGAIVGESPSPAEEVTFARHGGC